MRKVTIQWNGCLIIIETWCNEFSVFWHCKCLSEVSSFLEGHNQWKHGRPSRRESDDKLCWQPMCRQYVCVYFEVVMFTVCLACNCSHQQPRKINTRWRPHCSYSCSHTRAGSANPECCSRFWFLYVCSQHLYIWWSPKGTPGKTLC
jgi:hypothetical protein